MKYLTGNIRGMLCLTCLVLTTGLLLERATAETIYKTVDAKGNITFSNTPPPEGTNAQQIELPAGPTPAQVQESQQEEQNLENTANDMDSGENAGEPRPQEDEQPVEPTMEYQQGAGDDQDSVVVDDGYVGDRTRNEMERDRVDDRNEVTPGPDPVGVAHPEGRYRR